MATVSTKRICSVCNKSKISYNCQGCSKLFCLDHLSEHRKNLSRELEEIQNDHDQLRQDLNEQTTDPTKHSLIKQIDRWEIESINKIKQHAQLCREKLLKSSARLLHGIEEQLNNFAQQIKEIYQENEFTEVDLNDLKQKLQKLHEQLHRPRDISIRQQSTSFIHKISVLKSLGKGNCSSVRLEMVHSLSLDTRWKEFGITIAGGNGQGNQLNQLSYPYGIRVGDIDQSVYIADYANDRVVEWRPNVHQGRIMAGGNGKGNRIDQLNNPADVIIDQNNDSFIIADRGNRRVMRWSRQNSSQGQIIISDIDCSRLAMHKDGTLYVSDHKRNEVKRWKKGEVNGIKVAGGNGEGDRLDQLNNPTHLFVDDDHTLYISDRNNHRVIKWARNAKEGVVVAGGNGQADQLMQLFLPAGVIVNQFGQIFVADMRNNRVMLWCEGAKEGTIVVGGNGQGKEANELNFPLGLALDEEGNFYVADTHNYRVQKFETD